MAKFKLRPELDQWQYWAHLFVISAVVLGIFQFWRGGEMLTWTNWFFGAFIIALADIVAHTTLRLD